MNDDVSEGSEYIHGSSREEQHRLSLLNDILNESCLRELNLQPGEKVLDLGSGLGQFTRLIARTVGSRGHVIGIERDRHQILQAKRLADNSEESKLVEFRKGDALELPLSGSEWERLTLRMLVFFWSMFPGRHWSLHKWFVRFVLAEEFLSLMMITTTFVRGPNPEVSKPFGRRMYIRMKGLAMTLTLGVGSSRYFEMVD